jgi:uncharacterized membrane protein
LTGRPQGDLAAAVDDETQTPFDEDGAPPERSLGDDLKQLAEDSRTLVEAELHYQMSRARIAGSGFGKVATFAALAAVSAWFAMIALVVGLVIALAPLLTAWGSTGVVTAVLLVIGLVFWRIAMKRWQRITSLLTDEDSAR